MSLKSSGSSLFLSSSSDSNEGRLLPFYFSWVSITKFCDCNFLHRLNILCKSQKKWGRKKFNLLSTFNLNYHLFSGIKTDPLPVIMHRWCRTQVEVMGNICLPIYLLFCIGFGKFLRQYLKQSQSHDERSCARGMNLYLLERFFRLGFWNCSDLLGFLFYLFNGFI